MQLPITALATALLVLILPAATSAQTGIDLFDVTPTPTRRAPATSEPTSGSADPVLLKTIPIKDITAVTTAPLQPGASLPADAPNPQIVTTKPNLNPQIVNPLLPSSINPAKNP